MTETIALPLWAIASVVLVVVIVAAIAIARVGSRQSFGFFAQVAAALVLVAGGWFFLDRLYVQDKAEQRRTIEARLASLSTQRLQPNSTVACIDVQGGEVVSEACEKVLYGSAEQVAAALAYVGARLDLLREISELSPDLSDPNYARLRAPLARSLESDIHGLVAQVLQARDGCTPDACYAFDLLEQPGKIIANMTERAYDTRVVRHAANWGEKPSGPALASHTSTPAQAPSGNPVNINFPTAASIPPISIMANEPGMPGQNGVDTAAKPEPKSDARAEPRPDPRSEPKAAPRRPAQKAQAAPKQAQSAPPPPASPFPQPLGQAQTTGGAPVQITPQ